MDFTVRFIKSKVTYTLELLKATTQLSSRELPMNHFNLYTLGT